MVRQSKWQRKTTPLMARKQKREKGRGRGQDPTISFEGTSSVT
jgi:hypothetical protein